MICRLRFWWRRRREAAEICAECHRFIPARRCWETRVDFAPTGDIAHYGGGTFMTAYWCAEHRPNEAKRCH